jgi:hypothetical protein
LYVPDFTITFVLLPLVEPCIATPKFEQPPEEEEEEEDEEERQDITLAVSRPSGVTRKSEEKKNKNKNKKKIKKSCI